MQRLMTVHCCSSTCFTERSTASLQVRYCYAILFIVQTKDKKLQSDMIRVVVLNKWKTIGKHTVERDRKWKYYTVNYTDSLQFVSLSHEPSKSPLLLHPAQERWFGFIIVTLLPLLLLRRRICHEAPPPAFTLHRGQDGPIFAFHRGWDILSIQGE